MAPDEIILRVGKDGCVAGIYDERLDLTGLGRVAISRASMVEPDAQGRWWADLAISGGPVLGPFVRRSEALGAERRWIEQHVL